MQLSPRLQSSSEEPMVPAPGHLKSSLRPLSPRNSSPRNSSPRHYDSSNVDLSPTGELTPRRQVRLLDSSANGMGGGKSPKHSHSLQHKRGIESSVATLRLPSLNTEISRSAVQLSSTAEFLNKIPTMRRGRAYDIFEIDAHLEKEEEFATGTDSEAVRRWRKQHKERLLKEQQQHEKKKEETSLQKRARLMRCINAQRQRKFAQSRRKQEAAAVAAGTTQAASGSLRSQRRAAVSQVVEPGTVTPPKADALKRRNNNSSNTSGNNSSSNNPKNDAYNVRTNLHDTEEFMRDEQERQDTVAKQKQKGKDKVRVQSRGMFKRKRTRGSGVGGSGSNSRGGSSQQASRPGTSGNTVAQEQVAASAENAKNELEGEMHRYFGLQARIDFNDKYRVATKNLERFKDDAQLPAALLTPRSVYLRETAKEKLLPLPLLMRREEKAMGVHLNHRGLGDQRAMPLIKVLQQLPAIQTIELCDNRLTDATLMPLAQMLPTMRSLTYLDLSFNKIDKSSDSIMGYLRSEECQLYTLLLNGADVDDGECKNIADALIENKSIRHLSLSRNLIGSLELLNVLNPDIVTGGEAIGAMLRRNSTLTTLDLSWNSIRLESAVALAVALEENSTLSTLLLAYNSFGDMPSQILGRTLKKNQGLTVLDIESNSITPKAATVLANAIAFNETLLKLNINGNVLGKIGAQALVAAIQRSSSENRALEVSFINCDCVMDDVNVFSAANPHGTWRLDLSEPYGQMVAAECLYLANFKAGCRIVRLLYNGALVTLERSYVATSDEGEAGEVKKFKLEEFYRNSRAAATALMRDSSSSSSGEDNSSGSNMQEASRALQALLSQFGFLMDESQRMVVLEKTRELWTAKAKREGRDDLNEVFLYEVFFSLFVINDADMSGTMELDEFLQTLSSLGKPNFDRDTARRLMLEHDKDESGSIDANEFGTIMLNEFCQTDLPRGDLVDAATGQPWEIPALGHCVIQLSYQCDVPTLFDIGEDYGIDNIIRSIRDAKTDEQREILFQNTTSSPYFFLSFEQAQLLFDEMQGLNRLPLELMASICPQIVNEEQTNRFIDANLNDRGKFALRVKLGQLYNSYVGLHTGHYSIDLKAVDQRNGGRRLGAVSVTEGKFCRQAGTISAQKGNNSNFRNEKLGVTPVEVSGRWFASIKSTKTLHCDYVSTTKPRSGTQPMTDSRLQRIAEKLKLSEIRFVWDKLQRKKAQFLKKAARRDGDAEEDSEEDDDFSNSSNNSVGAGSNGNSGGSSAAAGLLGLRRASAPGLQSRLKRSATAATLSEDISAAGIDAPQQQSHRNTVAGSHFGDTLVDSSKGSSSSSSSSSRGLHQQQQLSGVEPPPAVPFTELCPGLVINLKDYPELTPSPPLTVVALKDAYSEYIDTSHHYYDIYPEERMRDMSRPGYAAAGEGRPVTPDDMKLEPTPPRHYLSPVFPLAYKRIIQLQLMMPSLYFSVAQLSRLLQYFPPEEGYLRVQLIQSTFSHIVDMENMYQIIDDVLTQDERNEIFHRIGILNLLDPMKPDRLYRLDLRRYDHREWTKILIALAIAEPGENWEQVEYRWAKYDEPVPGWSLPATWTWPDDGGDRGGPRSYGWLKLYYRSVGNGCAPMPSLRKFLRKRTLAGMKKII